MVILAPNQVADMDGRISNRRYEHRVTQYAKVVVFPDDISGIKCWIDDASTMTSIRNEATCETYKSLYQKDNMDDDKIPPSMRSAIVNLVIDNLKRNKDMLVQELAQLRNFLDTLQLELSQDIGKEAVRRLCNFTYEAIVGYTHYLETNDAWTDASNGLFGYDHTGDAYNLNLRGLNDNLYMQFARDYHSPEGKQGSNVVGDYKYILKGESTIYDKPYDFATYDGIYEFREDMLKSMLRLLATPVDEGDLLYQIFGKDLQDKVRYMNAIKTNIRQKVKGLFVADDTCNLFTEKLWFQFPADRDFMDGLVENKRTSVDGEYVYEPKLVSKTFPLNTDDWVFRMANRDLSTTITGKIRDAYVVQFKDNSNSDMWYLSSVDAFLMCQSNTNIVDLAYVQSTDSTYVLFQDDPYLYMFDHVAQLKDYHGRVLLQKENATIKLETAHSTSLSSNQGHDYIYVDYSSPTSWKMEMYGHVGDSNDVEKWLDDPGGHYEKFKMYNTIMFGDSLFTPSQLKFQNISKNKDMFDILDIGEVDGCYYGLFKDEINSTDEHPLYTVFKTAPEYTYHNGTTREGVVRRLPYKVVNPKLYVTKGGLYSLYVVEELDNGRKQLREVSVPDSDLYPYRTIPLQDVVKSDPLVAGEYAPAKL